MEGETIKRPIVLTVGLETRAFLEITRRLHNAGYEIVAEANGRYALNRLRSMSFDAVVVPTRPQDMDQVEFVLNAQDVAECPILAAKEGTSQQEISRYTALSNSEKVFQPRKFLITKLMESVPPGTT